LQNCKNNALLSEQERLAVSRSKDRAAVAKDLAESLYPRIGISLNPASDVSQYAGQIVGLLRGSSLRYNELAPQLAATMPPRELVRCIESADHASIADAAGISAQRAVRLISELRETDYSALLVAGVEDDVELSLKDGAEFKDIEHLSIGQRNTIVLPLLLKVLERPLIIDQPEDHLDNAFIVGTIVASMSGRKGHGQMIVTSHNANIPVLGDAERVFVLRSDGRRGYCDESGPVEDRGIVEAITTLMEGGKDAFKRRAQFYIDHGVR
jgi:hypothetical protein